MITVYNIINFVPIRFLKHLVEIKKEFLQIFSCKDNSLKVILKIFSRIIDIFLKF